MPQHAGPHALLPLSDVDLPPLARALVGHIRGQVQAHPCTSQTAPYVLLTGPGIDVFVRGADWQVLGAKLLAGVWSPPRTPPGAVSPASPVTFYDVALADQNDAFLYTLILADLKNLFPRTFPTSTL